MTTTTTKPITYLSGCVRSELMDARRPDLGVMLTPHMGNKVDLTATAWGADNGCFAQPQKYNEAKYLQFLADRPASTALFATAPDVVGDAIATLNKSIPALPKIRALGYQAALVAQDGLEAISIIPWHLFDVLFIGGTTDWKLGAGVRSLVADAKSRGKAVHMGRVNSLRRLRYAAEIGCDSADGTFVGFGPSINIPRLLGWLDVLNGTRGGKAAQR